jgi:LPXTG-motif cell wall-anchored protein
VTTAPAAGTTTRSTTKVTTTAQAGTTSRGVQTGEDAPTGILFAGFALGIAAIFFARKRRDEE